MKYRQLGEYYSVYRNDSPDYLDIYNAQGEEVSFEHIPKSMISSDIVWLNRRFFDGKQDDKAIEMQKQIMERFKNIETFFKGEDEIYTNMALYGNIFKLRGYMSGKRGIIEECYEVDENGILVPLEVRTRKKSYG